MGEPAKFVNDTLFGKDAKQDTGSAFQDIGREKKSAYGDTVDVTKKDANRKYYAEKLKADTGISEITKGQLLKQLEDPKFEFVTSKFDKAIQDAKNITNPETAYRKKLDERAALFEDTPGITSQTTGSGATLLSGYRQAQNNRLTKSILGK